MPAAVFFECCWVSLACNFRTPAPAFAVFHTLHSTVALPWCCCDIQRCRTPSVRCRFCRRLPRRILGHDRPGDGTTQPSNPVRHLRPHVSPWDFSRRVGTIAIVVQMVLSVHVYGMHVCVCVGGGGGGTFWLSKEESVVRCKPRPMPMPMPMPMPIQLTAKQQN